jgi:hypothetical protein
MERQATFQLDPVNSAFTQPPTPMATPPDPDKVSKVPTLTHVSSLYECFCQYCKFIHSLVLLLASNSDLTGIIDFRTLKISDSHLLATQPKALQPIFDQRYCLIYSWWFHPFSPQQTPSGFSRSWNHTASPPTWPFKPK